MTVQIDQIAVFLGESYEKGHRRANYIGLSGFRWLFSPKQLKMSRRNAAHLREPLTTFRKLKTDWIAFSDDLSDCRSCFVIVDCYITMPYQLGLC